jgi:hypothetical protein
LRWAKRLLSPRLGSLWPIVPVEVHPKKRVLGSAKGEFTVREDFNDPLPKEIEDLFYERRRFSIHTN